MFADTALDTSLSMKAGASASPWDPVHSSSAANGAHAVTGGSIAAGGIDDEFDLLSSRSKSPPTLSAVSAGTCALSYLDLVYLGYMHVFSFIPVLHCESFPFTMSDLLFNWQARSEMKHVDHIMDNFVIS